MRGQFRLLQCFLGLCAALAVAPACGTASTNSSSSLEGEAGAIADVGRVSNGSTGGARSAGEGGAAGDVEASGPGTAGTGGASDRSVSANGGSQSGAPDDGGAGGEQVAPEGPTCDPSAEDLPDDEFQDTNCDGIDGDESRSVFVASNGRDDAPGTRTNPLLTLNRALEVASPHRFAVLVCNGTYAENVVIRSGQRIYGGYACSLGWQRVKDRAIVQPDRGLGLLVDTVSDPVLVDRFAFRAANATEAGGSSQVAGIMMSSDVRLSHVEFASGNGAAGFDGVAGADAPAEPESGTDGADTSDGGCCTSLPLSSACKAIAKGGRANSVRCEFNGGRFETHGGDGGDGANIWRTAEDPSCLIGSTWGIAGARGRYRIDNGGWKTLAEGGPGGPGENGASGDGAALGIGDLKGALYIAANAGADGETGHPGWPGSGGDGGQSDAASGDVCQECFLPGSGGGQGGPGGCGGAGGKAGSGGGAAIGLVVFKSNVALSWARIITGNGGRGGAGAPGGRGQPGGLPGNPGAGSGASGTAGEAGGPGGDGGAGGPGGGGPSIGILYYGAAPAITESSFEIGQPGPGGALVGGKAAALGVTGEIYEFGK